jgi:hypothetical protein
MDAQRFDELTKKLAAKVSRRGVLRTLAGGIAAAGAAISRRGVTAAPSACSVGCAGLPGPQKAACKQACRECGGDFDSVCVQFGPFGPTSFTCCPEGTACSFEGECVEVTICPTGEPAENCAVGIESSCGEGGACALVEDADSDDCNCVERFCTEIPCTTDADCAESGGVCSTIPGCCAETTFCALPCGSGVGVTSDGAHGWSR